MKKKVLLGLVLACTALFAACGTNNKATKDTGTSSSAVAQVLTIEDSNGQVEVPKNPKKVVVFDAGSLDTMDALGVGDRVIGAAVDNLPAYLKEYKTVESAGGIKEPDLEKINQMQPDLIIISGRQQDFQEELSKIAPTIFLSVDTADTWASIQKNVRALGTIFDKSTEADKELAKLETSIDELNQAALKSDQTALVVLMNEGQLSAYGSNSRFGLIHDVFGFKQADDQIEPSTHGQSVSFEYVLEKNPDILFVVDRTKAIGGDATETSLTENELIKETTAAKNNKIIELQPDVWYLSGGGIESLGLMIEDVKQGLTK